MKKFNGTKRSLLMSGLALLLCVSMLIGSTFAWFTDSVTSTGNIIKSGKLEVTMEWKDATASGAQKAYKDASAGPIFNYDKWEPGYVEAKNVKIANAGTLALKYQLTIIPTGEVTKLADVIDVYYADGEVPQADRKMDGLKRIGTLTEVLAGMADTASGNLLPGANHTVTIALKMQESAGNDYQDLSIGSDFSVQLLATQLTYEEDSFDDQYDVEATYLNKDADGAWLITNMDELFFFASDVNSGNTYKGETVKLAADIDLAGYTWIPIGQPGPNGTTDFSTSFSGTFDGQDHTVSNMKVSNIGWAGLFGLAHNAEIKNVTVKNINIASSRMTGAIVGQLYGNVENCHVEDAVITVVPNWTGDEYDNGDKVGGIVGWLGDNGNNHYAKGCTVKNVTLKAYRDVGGVAGYIGSSSTVENCTVDTVSVTVDQVTNHYGVKTANAGAVVGRIWSDPVYVQGNTEVDVTVVVPASVTTADQLSAALAAGEKNIVLYAGSYTVPADSDVVFVGTGADTVIDLDGAIGNVNISNATVTGATNIDIDAGESAVFKNVVFDAKLGGASSGQYGSISGDVTFEGCTFEKMLHFDSTHDANILIENCTFGVLGTLKVGAGATSVVVKDSTFDITTATSIWGEKGIVIYCPVTFTNCEFNNRSVVTSPTGLTVTFNSCTMEGGKPVYYVDNTDGIIRGGNVPNVTIND